MWPVVQEVQPHSYGQLCKSTSMKLGQTLRTCCQVDGCQPALTLTVALHQLAGMLQSALDSLLVTIKPCDNSPCGEWVGFVSCHCFAADCLSLKRM